MNWLMEYWIIEGIVIICLALILATIICKVARCINGED